MKTHNMVVATLAVKNMVLGAPLRSVPGETPIWSDKRKYHAGVRQTNYNMLLTAQKLQPNWGAALIDGFEGMEGNGPGSGTPVPSRIAIASTDYIAADRVALETMGINPRMGRVPYLLRAGGVGAVRSRQDRCPRCAHRVRQAELPSALGHPPRTAMDGAHGGPPAQTWRVAARIQQGLSVNGRGLACLALVLKMDTLFLAVDMLIGNVQEFMLLPAVEERLSRKHQRKWLTNKRRRPRRPMEARHKSPHRELVGQLPRSGPRPLPLPSHLRHRRVVPHREPRELPLRPNLPPLRQRRLQRQPNLP